MVQPNGGSRRGRTYRLIGIRFRVERGAIGVKSLPLIQSPLGLLNKPSKFAPTLALDSLAALAT